MHFVKDRAVEFDKEMVLLLLEHAMTLSDGGRASFIEKQIHATSQGSEEEIRVILEVQLFFLLLCTLLLVPTRWSQSGSVEFHCAIRLDGAAEINLREEQFFFCSLQQRQ